MTKKLNILILLFAFIASKAQYKKSILELGVGFAGVRYSGDLLWGSESWMKFAPQGSIWLTFESNKLLAPLFKFDFAKFSADNRELRLENVQYNTFVKTSLFMPSVSVLIRPMNFKRIHPIASVGIGMIFFNPTDKDGLSLQDQQNTRANGEEYNTTALALPLSLGIHYKATPNFHISLLYNFLGSTTDYLDNIGELGKQKGNDKLQSIGIVVHFIPFKLYRQGRYYAKKRRAKKKCSCPKH